MKNAGNFVSRFLRHHVERVLFDVKKTPYFKFPRHTTSSTNRGEGVMGRGYTSNKKNLDFTVL